MRTANDRMSVQLVQEEQDEGKDAVFNSCRTPGEGSEMKPESRSKESERSKQFNQSCGVRLPPLTQSNLTAYNQWNYNARGSCRGVEPGLDERTVQCIGSGALDNVRNAYRTLRISRDSHSPLGEARQSSGSSPVEQSTPPHMRWARNLKNLLNDKEGADLLTQFLQQEGCGSENIQFYYACEGMKKGYLSGSKEQLQMIKVIYKTFIRYSKIVIGEATRLEIVEKINSRVGVCQTIFDRAQKELEENYLQNAYANFLKSDVFLRHVQKAYEKVEEEYEEEAPPSPHHSTSSNSNTVSHEALNLLPTLHEEKELAVEPLRNPHFVPFAQRESRHSARMNRYADMARYHPEQGYYAMRRPASHVKYSGYLPTSAQDSELQSLSSDAQTDDTMSVTTEGNSIETVSIYNSRSHCRKQRKAMRLNANANKDPSLQHTVIPRTQRMSPVRLAEEQPDVFAAVIIEKLTRVKKDIDDCEKLNVSLKLLNLEDGKGSQASTLSSNQPPAFDRFMKIPPQLLYTTAVAKVEDTDNVQDILDQHVSRVWNDSNCNSPLSPAGQQSPPHRQPLAPPHLPSVVPLDRRRPTGASSAPQPAWANPSVNPYALQPNQKAPLYGQPVYNAGRRRERDACSSDSGTVRDYVPEGEGPPSYYQKPTTVTVTSEDRRLKEGLRRNVNPKKSSNVTDSSSSCVDSGVSVCDPVMPSNLSTHERVFSWVSENEKYALNRSGPESDSSTRHKKSSSSLSTHSSKQSSKKQLSYNPSRGTTLEYPGSSGPRQPVAQDPCMPILPPPDTTTQLVEAKRRLEADEAAKSKPFKAKSTVGKEKHSHPDMLKLKAKTEEEAATLRKSSKRTSPMGHSSSAGSSMSSAEVTIIGYCFSGESVPYRTKIAGRNITLKQFKALISKKGNYRYFFKRSNNEFGTGVVNEEVSDDSEVLPLWEGKIFCTIDPVLE